MPSPTSPASGSSGTPTVNEPRGLLYRAAKAKDWTEVFRLIDREGGDVNAELGTSKRTLMQKAAYKGEFALMKRLHAKGGKTHGVSDSSGLDVMHSAVSAAYNVSSAKKINMLEWLRDDGADLSLAAGNKNRTLLHLAAEKNDDVLIEYLLSVVGNTPEERAAYANAKDSDGNTALHILAERSPSGATRPSIHRAMHMVIDAGADVNALNKMYQPPLLGGMRYETYLPNAKLLLDAGATLDHPRMPFPLEEMLKRKSNSTAHNPYGTNSSGFVQKPVTDFIKERRELPRIELDSYYRKEDLFKPNKHGHTPLDNPETWHNLEEIANKLDRRKTPLTRADLLNVNPVTKVPYLQRAIECRALTEVVEVLGQRGEQVEALDFAAGKDGQELNSIGQAAYEAGTMPREVFRQEFWKGKTVHELTGFYNELPELLRNQVDNLHVLKTALSRDNQTRER